MNKFEKWNWKSELEDSERGKKNNRKASLWARICSTARRGFMKGIYFGLAEVKSCIDKRKLIRQPQLFKPFMILSLSAMLANLV